MAVSCDRRVVGLWANEERSNAWVYLSGAGWRKLDDASDDACTNLLVLAAQAKAENATVKVNEELRGDRWYITEIYDLSPSVPPAAQEVSFSVAECVYGWTAGFVQQGANARGSRGHLPATVADSSCCALFPPRQCHHE